MRKTNNTYNTFDPYYKVKKITAIDSTFYRPNLKRIETDSNLKFPKNYLEFKKVKANKSYQMHPTEKPLALMEYLVKTYTKENDLVLDCFAGSGVIAVACMNLKRKCILVEKEQKYIDLIIKRINQHEQ